jgi:hypothetical protein
VDTQAANRRGWVSLFTRIVDTDDWGSTLFTDSSEIHEAAIKRFKSSMAYGAVNVHRQEILRRAIETYFKTELDTLQSEYPIVRRDIRERLKKADSIYDSFQRLSQFAENTTASFDFDRSKFIDSVTDTITNNMEIYGWVSDTIANMQQREQQKYERRKARAESWSTKWCLATTTWIAETSANSWETLCNAVSCVYGGIKTFFAYLWMLAKAKKQGACPYIRFTDEKH